MGKSQPTPPPAPDPNVVSAAQTKSNQQTALYQSQLNNGNSYGPNGSVTNSYNPTTNQWTQNTQLSPQQQAIYDQGTSAEAGALGIANHQLGNVQTALNSTLTGYNPATSVQGGQIAGGYGSGGPIQYGYGQGQPVQGQVSSGAPIQYGYANGGPIQQGVNTNSLQNGYDQGGQIQGQVANAGGITGSYGQGQPLQSTYGAGGQIQGQIGGADINQSVQNAGNAAYSQATSRLDPQWQQASEQQQAQLVAQGLNPNSTAYQNSMQLFNNARNDAYNQANFSAVAAGNQEQNTLFGQQAAQGQFANAAQAQANAQNAGAAQFYNAAQGQQNAQNQQQATFQNAAQAQGYGQNLSSGNFANAAQSQANSQNAAQANFYNQSQLSGFGENLQAGQFGNAAQAQGNSQNAAALAAYNAAQGQQYGQGLSSGQFANTAAAQQYAQNQGNAQFANTAQSQANTQNQAAASFANTAQQQAYNESLNNANLYNSANQQAFQNQAYQQQLPINELTALLSSGQVSMPGAYAGSNTSVAPTDVLGAYSLQSQALNSQYQSQMQNYQSQMGGLFNLGSAAMSLLPFSDVRLKRDISPAGTWRGHNIYNFKYLWSDEPQVGVIAQEVAQTHPHAVGERDGFMTVDYGKL